MEPYRTIRKAIERAFTAHGLVIGHWNVTVTAKADGTHVLRRTRHMSEGALHGISFEMADAHSPDEDARIFSATVARLARRDRALASKKHLLSRPPAWAHVADQTVTGIVRRLGAPIETLHTWRLSSPRDIGWHTSLNTESFAGAGVLGAASFALRTRAHVDALSYDGVLWISDATGTPIVTVARSIPATIGVAAVGRPLDAIIDHPLTNGLDAMITRIEQRDQLALISLETRLAPLAEPPPGVDASWLMPPQDEPFGG